MLQLPKISPCSLNLFSLPNCCHSLPSVLDFSLPVTLKTWIYLLPSIFFLFSSSCTIPSKVIFFSSSKKNSYSHLSHYSLWQNAKYTVIFPLVLCPKKDKVVCACSYLLHIPWNEKHYSVSTQKDPSDSWALCPQSREANISQRTASDFNILAA